LQKITDWNGLETSRQIAVVPWVTTFLRNTVSKGVKSCKKWSKRRGK